MLLCRLFEGSWLSPQGCPQGAVIDISCPITEELDTFALKDRLESSYMLSFASPEAYLDYILLPFPSLREGASITPMTSQITEIPHLTPQGIPFRLIDPQSDQPYVGLLRCDEKSAQALEDFARERDNIIQPPQEFMRAFAAFCEPYPFHLQCARRGGMALSCGSVASSPFGGIA